MDPNYLLKLALNTAEEMFSDRGYKELESRHNTDVYHRLNERKYETPSGKLAICVILDSTSQIKNYSEFIEDPDYESITCIYRGNINIAHKKIEKNSNYKIEILSVNFLIKNVSKHELQPIVTKDDTYVYSPNERKLPKIMFYDPIVRYYRFKHKDILKTISRISGNVEYRIVV